MIKLFAKYGQNQEHLPEIWGIRVSNSYHLRFKGSREGNSITEAQLKTRSLEEGPTDRSCSYREGN